MPYKNPADQQEYYRNHRVACDASATRSRHKLKVLVVQGYGGRCTHCGIDDIDILTIDHVNDDGSIKRGRKYRQNYNEVGHALYRRLRNESFPSEYQVLCANCNLKKEIERRKCNAKSKRETG